MPQKKKKEKKKRKKLDSIGIGITKCDKKDYKVRQVAQLQSVTRIGLKCNNCRIKNLAGWITKCENDCKV